MAKEKPHIPSEDNEEITRRAEEEVRNIAGPDFYDLQEQMEREAKEDSSRINVLPNEKVPELKEEAKLVRDPRLEERIKRTVGYVLFENPMTSPVLIKDGYFIYQILSEDDVIVLSGLKERDIIQGRIAYGPPHYIGEYNLLSRVESDSLICEQDELSLGNDS